MKQLTEPAEAGQPDLSDEIERTAEREPMDEVRCVRLFDDCYRCNWWAPAAAEGGRVPLAPWEKASAYRIRKSLFMRASTVEGKLVLRS